MKPRTRVLWVSTIAGVLAAIAASLFAVAGAGIYGTPFAGNRYFNAALFLVLLFGPFAILPCTLLAIWKARWGGIILCTSAIAETVSILLLNQREWGFAIHDAAIAFCVIALPVFVLGSLLFRSDDSADSKWKMHLWRLELAVMAIVSMLLLWQVGNDAITFLYYWCR